MSEIEQAIEQAIEQINRELLELITAKESSHVLFGKKKKALENQISIKKLAIQALQEKAKREKEQTECNYCHDASFRQAGQYVDSEEGYKISGINHYCINCGRKLVGK